MFSFYGRITAPQPQSTLSFQQLVDFIRNNPNQSKIDLLRSLEYGSKDYKSLKNTFPLIRVNGVFRGNKDQDLQTLSGYLYFDIDGEIIDQETLLSLAPFSLICKSIGGGGMSMLLRVKGLTKDNFYSVWHLVRNEYLGSLNIDKNAFSFTRVEVAGKFSRL